MGPDVWMLASTVTGLDESVERILDLTGILVFAVSGALLAVHKRFDLVGLLVLGAVTALGGGVLRDVLLGDTPPLAIRDGFYLATPLVAACAVFVAHPLIDRKLRRPVLVFDAAGLALFSVTGTVKALSFGVDAVGSVALGVVTAVGGGIARDVLAREEPALFRSDSVLYGVPAALGATIVVVAWRLDVYSGLVAATAVAVVFLLRIGALRFGWHAPRPRPRTQHTSR